jgi:hypothetical protein
VEGSQNAFTLDGVVSTNSTTAVPMESLVESAEARSKTIDVCYGTVGGQLLSAIN